MTLSLNTEKAPERLRFRGHQIQEKRPEKAVFPILVSTDLAIEDQVNDKIDIGNIYFTVSIDITIHICTS